MTLLQEEPCLTCRQVPVAFLSLHCQYTITLPFKAVSTSSRCDLVKRTLPVTTPACCLPATLRLARYATHEQDRLAVLCGCAP